MYFERNHPGVAKTISHATELRLQTNDYHKFHMSVVLSFIENKCIVPQNVIAIFASLLITQYHQKQLIEDEVHSGLKRKYRMLSNSGLSQI